MMKQQCTTTKKRARILMIAYLYILLITLILGIKVFGQDQHYYHRQSATTVLSSIEEEEETRLDEEFNSRGPSSVVSIFVPDLPHALTFNDDDNEIGQQDLTRYLYRRMLHYPGRTTNASEALIWYLPGPDSCSLPSDCPRALEELVKLKPNSSQIVIYAGSWRPNRSMQRFPTIWNNTFWKITVEDVVRKPEQKWMVVPYITSKLLPCSNTNNNHRNSTTGGLATAAAAEDNPDQPVLRDYTIACAVGYRKHRRSLLSVCQNHSKIVYLKPSSSNQTENVLELYARTTFSFQPMGDSYSRKGIFDALRMGNIPILFHERSFHLPLFIPWEQANNTLVLHLSRFLTTTSSYNVVVVPEEERMLQQMTNYIVHNLSRHHVRHMQKQIYLARHLLHYSGCLDSWEDKDALWHLLNAVHDRVLLK